MVRSLRYMPYAQAKVWDGSMKGYEQIILTSYSTDVIIVTGNYMRCTGLYSMTTRKHISAFLREYYPHISFYDVKEIAGRDDLRIDTTTGKAVKVC